jgi:serine/threonine-protein kinase ATR
MRVDSVISAIDKDLLARAALKCKAYSLSLMNFEGRIIEMRSQQGLPSSQFHEAYERLHELYAALDEPDAMAGVTALIPSPSLEHQIRQHESNGRWTSAQSCWEVRLQESPDNPAHHMGLLRCLRNLGHFGQYQGSFVRVIGLIEPSDTVRTHVKGLLTRHREWEPTLADFHVESAWMVGDWVDVRSILDTTHGQTPQVMLARLLLSIQSRDEASVPNALKQARLQLGTRLSELGADGHRQTYDALVDLHLIEEIERIHSADISPDPARAISKLLDVLPCRLDLTLPTFSNRERILGMRRTAYQLRSKSLFAVLAPEAHIALQHHEPLVY